MKKVLLSFLLIATVSYAEPVGIEQEIGQIEVQIKRLQDRKKFLEAQLTQKEEVAVVEEKTKEETKKEDLGFKTHVELGYLATSGNTDTVTYNFDGNIKKEWDKHVLTLSLLKIYGEENQVENKNSLFTELDYYYKFTDRFAFDYMIAYKEDKFSGFNNQVYTGPGLAYKAINEKTQTLFLKGNVLYSRDDVEETTTAGVGNDDAHIDEYGSYKAQLLYKYDIFKNLKFSEDFRYRGAFDDKENFFIYSKAALSSKLSDIFSISLSHQIDYVNQEVEGKTSTDKTTMFNLIIDY